MYNQRKNLIGGGQKITTICNFQTMPDKYSNHDYNKNLQPFANRLRKEMIPIAIGTEACLWKLCTKSKKPEWLPVPSPKTYP
jgi:hypothetical protein